MKWISDPVSDIIDFSKGGICIFRCSCRKTTLCVDGAYTAPAK